MSWICNNRARTIMSIKKKKIRAGEGFYGTSLYLLLNLAVHLKIKLLFGGGGSCLESRPNHQDNTERKQDPVWSANARKQQVGDPGELEIGSDELWWRGSRKTTLPAQGGPREDPLHKVLG